MKRYWFILLGLLAWAAPAMADVVVTDFLGREIRLTQPATRIVALAPHVVENLYTAGVGDLLVGVVEHSDYPAAAKQLPRVGDYTNASMEAVVALAPHLVITWASDPGAARAVARRTSLLNIPTYIANPRTLEDIADAIVDYGILGGRGDYARAVATKFRKQLAALRAQYANRRPVSVFYQVWSDPLVTLSGKEFVGAVIRLCGGHNIFSELNAVAPKISLEAVLVRNPQAIVASGVGGGRPQWLEDWKQWPELQAVKNEHLFYVSPDLIQRPTVRILRGAERLCRQLQAVRSGDPRAAHSPESRSAGGE